MEREKYRPHFYDSVEKRSFDVLFTFSVQPAVKTDAPVSFVPQMNVRMVDLNSQRMYRAIVLAVHDTVNNWKTLHSVLAPKYMRPEVEEVWRVQGENKVRSIDTPLRFKQRVHFCVPLSDHNDHDHLPLMDHCLR